MYLPCLNKWLVLLCIFVQPPFLSLPLQRAFFSTKRNSFFLHRQKDYSQGRGLGCQTGDSGGGPAAGLLSCMVQSCVRVVSITLDNVLLNPMSDLALVIVSCLADVHKVPFVEFGRLQYRFASGKLSIPRAFDSRCTIARCGGRRRVS
jgi:hypothetical protein